MYNTYIILYSICMIHIFNMYDTYIILYSICIIHIFNMYNTIFSSCTMLFGVMKYDMILFDLETRFCIWCHVSNLISERSVLYIII